MKTASVSRRRFVLSAMAFPALILLFAFCAATADAAQAGSGRDFDHQALQSAGGLSLRLDGGYPDLDWLIRGTDHDAAAGLTRCWCMNHGSGAYHDMLAQAMRLYESEKPRTGGEAALFQPPENTPPTLVKTSGDAEWKLWRLQPGTRSEGLHGRLYVNGEEVPGTIKGETIATAIGEFVWQGNFASRRYLWDESGWLPADPDAMPDRHGLGNGDDILKTYKSLHSTSSKDQ